MVPTHVCRWDCVDPDAYPDEPRRATVMVVGVPAEVVDLVRHRCASRAAVLERSPATAAGVERLLDLEAPSVLVIGEHFGADPAAFVRRLKAPPHRAFLPVLALVTSAEQRRAVWAAGADMALELPCGADDVSAAVDGLLGRCEQIERQLGVDLATGLLGPDSFSERLDEAIKFVRRYHVPGCAGVLVLTAPHGGLPAGAQVPFTLRWAASIARASLREVDSLGVAGADAIGAVMLGTTLGGGIVAMRRLLEHVSSGTFSALDGHAGAPQATAAVTSFGSDGVERLMERIQRALSRAGEREPGTLVIL